MNTAIKTFNSWAQKNKDVGMEKNHTFSVNNMLELIPSNIKDIVSNQNLFIGNWESIKDTLVLESSNGHYLFRWIGKVNDYYEFSYDNSILIHKDHFNKSDIKATNVDFYSDNTYQVWHATNKSFHTFKNGKDYGTYPNLEQLIPDKLDCLPGNSISFNSQYLGLYFNAIYKYQSNNKVSELFSNKPTNPVVIKSELDFNRLENTDVTFLIMPVIKRK